MRLHDLVFRHKRTSATRPPSKHSHQRDDKLEGLPMDRIERIKITMRGLGSQVTRPTLNSHLREEGLTCGEAEFLAFWDQIFGAKAEAQFNRRENERSKPKRKEKKMAKGVAPSEKSARTRELLQKVGNCTWAAFVIHARAHGVEADQPTFYYHRGRLFPSKSKPTPDWSEDELPDERPTSAAETVAGGLDEDRPLFVKEQVEQADAAGSREIGPGITIGEQICCPPQHFFVNGNAAPMLDEVLNVLKSLALLGGIAKVRRILDQIEALGGTANVRALLSQIEALKEPR